MARLDLDEASVQKNLAYYREARATGTIPDAVIPKAALHPKVDPSRDRKRS